jgi:hypothetical protein
MRGLPQDDSLDVPIFQLRGELVRLTVTGARCDNGERCKLLLVADAGGSFALYPHGAAQLGVRIAQSAAETLANAILAAVESAPGRQAP